MKTVISAPPTWKNPDFQNQKFWRNFEFPVLFSFFKEAKRTFQKALIWKTEAGAKFLARRKLVGKGKARWHKAHTFYKQPTLYIIDFFPITKENNRKIVFSLLIWDDKQKNNIILLLSLIHVDFHAFQPRSNSKKHWSKVCLLYFEFKLV